MIHLTILFRRPKSSATRPLGGGSDLGNFGTVTWLVFNWSLRLNSVVSGFPRGEGSLQYILQRVRQIRLIPLCTTLRICKGIQVNFQHPSSPNIERGRIKQATYLPTKQPSRPSRRLHFVKQLEVGAPTERERHRPGWMDGWMDGRREGGSPNGPNVLSSWDKVRS